MISILEQQISELQRELGSFEGKIDFLQSSISSNKSKVKKLTQDKETHIKAIEIINFVQEQSREKFKESFENIVTYALRFIYSSDYQFGMDFDRRGNLGTIEFNIKSPEFQEQSEPCDTSGGGVLDICALALRIALIQISQVKGPIILDESLKHLSKDYLKKASDFLYEISKKLDKQIIMITHQQEFIDNAEYSLEIK